jgi:hypothetical protein
MACISDEWSSVEDKLVVKLKLMDWAVGLGWRRPGGAKRCVRRNHVAAQADADASPSPKFF